MTDQSIPKLVAELRALHAKATPIPWTNEHMEEGHLAILAGGGPSTTLVALVDRIEDDEQRELANASLIPAMRNALPELLDALEERQWRPIETAPRDGTHILLFAPAWPAPSTGWTFGADDWQACPYHHAGEPSWKPTLWQPLPAPPSSVKEG